MVECLIEKLPDLMMVYSFGSFGGEYETAQSDIDIAIFRLMTSICG